MSESCKVQKNRNKINKSLKDDLMQVDVHQGSALSLFLFVMVMDRLTDEVRQDFQWTMMFADDIVIHSESRRQVEEKLEMEVCPGKKRNDGSPQQHRIHVCE